MSFVQYKNLFYLNYQYKNFNLFLKNGSFWGIILGGGILERKNKNLFGILKIIFTFAVETNPMR
ncbi:MAG: hypothetical protein RL757_823 [Bacteroidota bacterium]